MSPSVLFFFFKIILGSLKFHMNFRISLSIYAEKRANILIVTKLNLYTSLKGADALKILNFQFICKGLLSIYLHLNFFEKCLVRFSVLDIVFILLNLSLTILWIIISEIIFLVIFLDFSLPLCRNTIEFSVLFFYPET